VKIGRNQPCPCGSGKKYKRCCWERDRNARVTSVPAPSPHCDLFDMPNNDLFDIVELDRLSNSVVHLVNEGRLDEADTVCEQLRTEYPEVHDWLMRKAMVCEARGQTDLAIEYCQLTIDWMDAHPEDFDPESREPFYADIERLRRAGKDTN
jgi:SEC-C motif